MSTFKEQIEADVEGVFFNLDEFGEEHRIDDKTMTIIIDDDLLQKRKSSASNPTDGVYGASFLFHAKKSDFEKKPVIDARMKVDDQIYYVSDVQTNDETYVITLRRNKS